jgi:hypothetical protein
MKHKGGETGIIPLWMYPPYFRYQPAKFDADSGLMFTDDDLPSSRDTDDRDLNAHPEYMPKAERVVIEEQPELGDSDDA